MPRIQLETFGIHEDADGVRHLFQDLCPDGFNYVGLKGSAGLTTRKFKEPCPHAIIPSLGLRTLPTKHWQTFLRLANDPLIKAMIPTPEDSDPVYLNTEGMDGQSINYISCLERMSTPMTRSIHPLWAMSLVQVKKLLSLSNIHPLVLTGATEDDGTKVSKLMELAALSHRKLVITGTRQLILDPKVNRISSGLTRMCELGVFISLPFEHIGGEIIKRYCRRVSLLVEIKD